MMLLTSTSDLVRVITAEAAAIDVHASWVDNNAGTYTPGSTNTASITTATTTTVVSSPGASTQRNIKCLTVSNEHASTSCFVTMVHSDGTNANTLISCRLLAGEKLILTKVGAWVHYDANGGIYPYLGSAVTGPLIADQAAMESGTTTRLVTPAVQHYHPGHPKFRVKAGTTGNDLGSYNVSSLTDTGTGLVTVNIGTDFSSADWACITQVERASTSLAVANCRQSAIQFGGQAAGTLIAECHDLTAGTLLLADPTSWHIVGLGDQ